MGGFNVDKIVSYIKKYPLLHPHKYEVIITSNMMILDEDIMFNCHRCHVPGHNIGSFDHSIVGPKRRIPNEEIYDDLSTSFYNSEHIREFEAINKWMEFIGGNKSWRLAYYEDIVAEMQINIYGLDGNKNAQVKIHEAYPIGLSEIELSYAGETPSDITVNWAYHSFDIMT